MLLSHRGNNLWVCAVTEQNQWIPHPPSVFVSLSVSRRLWIKATQCNADHNTIMCERTVCWIVKSCFVTGVYESRKGPLIKQRCIKETAPCERVGKEMIICEKVGHEWGFIIWLKAKYCYTVSVYVSDFVTCPKSSRGKNKMRFVFIVF